MKKRMLMIGILVVLVGAGFFGYRAYARGQASAQDDLQTATVQRGSLTSTLSSAGNTRSAQSATIVWQTSGKVSEISLQLGDLVQEDQVLAALDPTTLPSEMITARESLIDAQQALDDLLNSKTQQAQALQAVEDAQEALDSLKQDAADEASQAQLALVEAQEALEEAQSNRIKMDYPHSTNKLVIEKAETDYLVAKQAYKDAKKEYEKVDQKKLTNPERVQALSRLVSAEQEMNSKLAVYNWYLLDYSDEDIAQADAELAVAQANLEKAQNDYDNTKNGTSKASIDLAEAQLSDAQREYERIKNGPSQEEIDAAQAAVDAAQATLDHAQLTAPFSGTITELDVKTGDLASSGESAFRIDDLSGIYVDLEISEIDLASLEVGQPATLEFDAIADKQYTGEVTNIGMIGNVSQGVVNYPVTVRVTNADEQIRPGMTASVTIVTDQRDDVLIVPNKAIHTSNGQRTVTILKNGQQITIPVTVGLISDSMSEVTSDQLKEGDLVVINGSTATTTTTGTQNSTNGGNFGGLGGFDGPPPGGMP